MLLNNRWGATDGCVDGLGMRACGGVVQARQMGNERRLTNIKDRSMDQLARRLGADGTPWQMAFQRSSHQHSFAFLLIKDEPRRAVDVRPTLCDQFVRPQRVTRGSSHAQNVTIHHPSSICAGGAATNEARSETECAARAVKRRVCARE